MLELDIPGFGRMTADYFVCDFTGTLSRNGVLLHGVPALMRRISSILDIHVLSADTFGTANRALRALPCRLTLVSDENSRERKRDFIMSLGADRVVAMGNGANDRLMLEAARLGIAVIEAEGAAKEAIEAADIVVNGGRTGLELILNPKRIIATLRS